MILSKYSNPVLITYCYNNISSYFEYILENEIENKNGISLNYFYEIITNSRYSHDFFKLGDYNLNKYIIEHNENFIRYVKGTNDIEQYVDVILKYNRPTYTIEIINYLSIDKIDDLLEETKSFIDIDYDKYYYISSLLKKCSDIAIEKFIEKGLDNIAPKNICDIIERDREKYSDLYYYLCNNVPNFKSLENKILYAPKCEIMDYITHYRHGLDDIILRNDSEILIKLLSNESWKYLIEDIMNTGNQEVLDWIFINKKEWIVNECRGYYVVNYANEELILEWLENKSMLSVNIIEIIARRNLLQCIIYIIENKLCRNYSTFISLSNENVIDYIMDNYGLDYFLDILTLSKRGFVKYNSYFLNSGFVLTVAINLVKTLSSEDILKLLEDRRPLDNKTVYYEYVHFLRNCIERNILEVNDYILDMIIEDDVLNNFDLNCIILFEKIIERDITLGMVNKIMNYTKEESIYFHLLRCMDENITNLILKTHPNLKFYHELYKMYIFEENIKLLGDYV